MNKKLILSGWLMILGVVISWVWSLVVTDTLSSPKNVAEDLSLGWVILEYLGTSTLAAACVQFPFMIMALALGLWAGSRWCTTVDRTLAGIAFHLILLVPILVWIICKMTGVITPTAGTEFLFYAGHGLVSFVVFGFWSGGLSRLFSYGSDGGGGGPGPDDDLPDRGPKSDPDFERPIWKGPTNRIKKYFPKEQKQQSCSSYSYSFFQLPFC